MIKTFYICMVMIVFFNLTAANDLDTKEIEETKANLRQLIGSSKIKTACVFHVPPKNLDKRRDEARKRAKRTNLKQLIRKAYPPTAEELYKTNPYDTEVAKAKLEYLRPLLLKMYCGHSYNIPMGMYLPIYKEVLERKWYKDPREFSVGKLDRNICLVLYDGEVPYYALGVPVSKILEYYFERKIWVFRFIHDENKKIKDITRFWVKFDDDFDKLSAPLWQKLNRHFL